MLLREDFDTHMYPEIIGVIERQDNDILEKAIAAAEGEAKGYLSRYDIETLFETTGVNRDPTLLLYLKDIAMWHFILLANPDTDLELRRTRFEDAIKWFEKIQAGKIVQKQWPIPSPEVEGSDIWLVSSQPRRKTRY